MRKKGESMTRIMNKMNIKVDTLENNRDATLNELRVAVQTKIKKYFELITDYK